MRFLRRISAIAAGVLLALTPTSALAIGGNSGSFYITGIWITGNNEVFIFGSGIANPDGCGSASYIALDPSNAANDKFLSTLLTAKSTGKPVNFWMIGCIATSNAPSVALGVIVQMP